MKNLVPDTPRTCLSIMKKNSSSRLWQNSWTKFYNIYFDFVKICVINKFKKYNWKLSNELTDETITLVFTNLLNSITNYDPNKNRFHKYLYGIIRFSVLQVIKVKSNDRKAIAFNESQNEIKYLLKKKEFKDGEVLDIVIEKLTLLDDITEEKNFVENLCEEEKAEALKALYKELIEITKSKVSPRIYAVFEMRVVENLSAEETAKRLGIKPSMVDNDKYKFIKKLNEIASEPPYCDEIKNLKM